MRLVGTLTCLLLAGCGHSVSYASSIDRSAIPGPHGESIIQVICNVPLGCVSAAREQCGGDFDVVASGSTAMLVHCLTPDGGVPTRPDSGV